MTPARKTRPTCSVDGCDRAVLARGLCEMHYSRARRGRPLTDEAAPPVGSPAGLGRYGIMDTDEDLMLCHECGRWLRSVGAHLARAHDGLTAREYRRQYGIPAGAPLVAPSVSAAMSTKATARVGTPAWLRLEAARDPAAAAAARTEESLRSTRSVHEGRAQVARDRATQNRRPRVVACLVCDARWCPLPGGYTRKVCSPECRATLARWQQTGRRATPARDAAIYAQVMRLGRTYREVGADYGMTPEGIGRIVRRLRRARA